jgi:pimeloyl-ACP methyl ester carboxylesterase
MSTGALNWEPCLDALRQRFRVVVLDHRGHGRGLRGKEPFSLEACADDVVALADALGVGSFIPVGYSMGGPIGQLVWRRHRERVDGLVFVATAADLRSSPAQRLTLDMLGWMGDVVQALPSVVRVELARSLLGGQQLSPEAQRSVLEELSRHDARAITDAARAIGQYDATGWIGDVDVPTVVLLTSKDTVIPPSRQRQLADRIPGASLVTVDADHGVCFTEADMFVPALMDACTAVSERARARSRNRVTLVA